MDQNQYQEDEEEMEQDMRFFGLDIKKIKIGKIELIKDKEE